MKLVMPIPCYQVLLPTLYCPEHAAITSKYAWARHHIQHNGSLLSTLQAPNNWFHYPITLNKRKYCLATQQKIHRHILEKSIGNISGKELSPSKVFIFSSNQAPISLRKLCFLLYTALGRTFTLLTSTLPGHSRNKPTSILCL